jgi:hypothetical protein
LDEISSAANTLHKLQMRAFHFKGLMDHCALHDASMQLWPAAAHAQTQALLTESKLEIKWEALEAQLIPHCSFI